MAAGLRSELPSLEHVVVLADGQPAPGKAGPVEPAVLDARRPALDRTAQLLFTSGTSGEPKGVLHRHDVLMRAADAHIRHFALGSQDVAARCALARVEGSASPDPHCACASGMEQLLFASCNAR